MYKVNLIDTLDAHTKTSSQYFMMGQVGIGKSLTIEGQLMLDTGANCTLISTKFMPAELEYRLNHDPESIEGLAGSANGVPYILTSLSIGSAPTLEHYPIYFADLPNPMLLGIVGTDFLTKFKSFGVGESESSHRLVLTLGELVNAV